MPPTPAVRGKFDESAPYRAVAQGRKVMRIATALYLHADNWEQDLALLTAPMPVDPGLQRSTRRAVERSAGVMSGASNATWDLVPDAVRALDLLEAAAIGKALRSLRTTVET